MILGSIITSIIGPFANAFGWVMAGFYSFTHSFGLSIVLLTLVAMVLAFPLTRAGTRSMMRMQILQPELMKIRNKHKVQPGMSAEERQASRAALNEEMMALYRENGVNPTGGCLPMFLQFPIFIVLYNVIRGMTHAVTLKGHKLPILQPEYIPHKTQLYNAVISSHGHLGFIGLNLADSVRSPGGFAAKIPYILVVLIAVVLQYVSIWQITNRNPNAAAANPQMQTMQRVMPLIFLFIYIFVPSGVGVYFIVSSAFRIGQQEYMYKHDPKIVESVAKIHAIKAAEKASGKPAAGKQPGARGGARAALAPSQPSTKSSAATGAGTDAASGRPRSFRERLRDAAAGFQGAPADVAADSTAPPAAVDTTSSSNGTAVSSNGSNGSSGSKAPRAANRRDESATPAAVNSQNRSRAKRRRR